MIDYNYKNYVELSDHWRNKNAKELCSQHASMLWKCLNVVNHKSLLFTYVPFKCCVIKSEWSPVTYYYSNTFDLYVFLVRIPIFKDYVRNLFGLVILFILVLITSQFTYKLKKCRCCARDSNTGLLDGSRRRIHWTMCEIILLFLSFQQNIL